MLPPSVQKLIARQEVMMAMILAWIVLPVVCTLMGFYLGTFVASQHVQDLQGGEIDKGAVGALIGLAVSILIGIGAAIQYPKVIEAEYVARESRHHHH